LLMSLFGGLAKAERNRIRHRVRAAMAAHASAGRWLGGRPPFGYRFADAGPHPNPEKAASGVRLHQLEEDPSTATTVRRMFDLYVHAVTDTKRSPRFSPLTACRLRARPTPLGTRIGPATHGPPARCGRSSPIPATSGVMSTVARSDRSACLTPITRPSGTGPRWRGSPGRRGSSPRQPRTPRS
jgi:hypothetical protein